MKKVIMLSAALLAVILPAAVYAAPPQDTHIYQYFVEESKPATCKEDGFDYYRCINHSDIIYRDPIPKLGHEYTGELTKVPTCQEEGLNTFTCIRGDDVYLEKISKLEHQYTKDMVEATCTEESYAVFHCSRCGDIYTEPRGGALGHNYVSQIKREPAKEKTGIREFRCTRCGASYTEPIPALAKTKLDSILPGYGAVQNLLGENNSLSGGQSSKLGISFLQNQQRTKPKLRRGETEAVTINTTVTPQQARHRQVEKKGISSMQNLLILTLSTASMIAAGGFGYSIYVDLYVLRWYRRRKKKVLYG